MKLLELGLLRFGPFTDVKLDFSAAPLAVHVVYGSNATGKSTSLRAITGLLYGIPWTTSDDHRHKKGELRLAGAVLTPEDAVLRFVRRKGRKNTLLQPDGDTPLDEAVLARALAGVGEDVFKTMFGLDRVALQQSGKALMEGGGLVGEVLFDAGVGGRSIHRVLQRFRAEADALYAPRATTRPLNAALAAVVAARRRLEEQAVSVEAYETQRDAIAAARREHDEVRRARESLREEQAGLVRALKVLPLLARHARARTARLELGAVTLLPPDAAPRRAAAERRAGDAARDVARLRAEIAAHEAERDALVIPESLAAVEEAEIGDLRDLLGRDRAATRDAPKLRGKLAALQDEARALGRAAGMTDADGDVEGLRVPRAVEASLEALATQQSGLTVALDDERRRLADAEAAVAELRAEVAALPAQEDVSELRAALVRGRDAGVAEARLEQLTMELAEHEAAERRALSAQPFAVATVDELVALRVPPRESVEAAASSFQALAAERARRGEALAAAVERLAAAEQELGAVQREGDVPTEQVLADRRGRRDDLWRRIARGLRGDAPEPPAELVDGYELAVRDADHVADRLRREAEKTVLVVRLIAERDAALAAEARCRSVLTELADREARAVAAWRGEWHGAGVTPLEPAAMLGWLRLRDSTVALAAALDRARAERTLLTERVAVVAEALRRALGASESERLGDLVREAERRVEAVRAAAQARASAERALASHERDRAATAKRAAAREEALAAWRASWGEACSRLGLPPGATVQEVRAVVAGRAAFFAKHAEVAALQGRIDGIERDARHFADRVARLAARHLPSATGLRAEDAAEELLRRWTEARHALGRRRRLSDEIEHRLAELREAERVERSAREELERCVREAGVADVSELPAAERRAERAVAIDAELVELDEQILAVGGGTVAELERRFGGVDVDAANARSQAIDDEDRELEERLLASATSIQRGVGGLERLQAGAADAALDLEAAVARARALHERWLRARLATALLEREVESYREANQGPVLARASRLFPRLTLGRFLTLKEGFDENDRPVLRCVRADGSEVGVSGLSEGEADQLYFSLRVASLAHYAEKSPAMPLVLDDVLQSFDEDRSRVALEILGELAESVQVLLFTHHRRVVEIARAALADRTVVHDLDRLAG